MALADVGKGVLPVAWFGAVLGRRRDLHAGILWAERVTPRVWSTARPVCGLRGLSPRHR